MNVFDYNNQNDLISSNGFKNQNTNLISQDQIFYYENTKFLWKQLIKINTLSIIKSKDISLLEPYVENILYSKLNNYDIDYLSNEYIVQLVTLLQLTGQYLVYVQKRLEIENEELKERANEAEGNEKQIERLQNIIDNLNRENQNKDFIIKTYNIIDKGNGMSKVNISIDKNITMNTNLRSKKIGEIHTDRKTYLCRICSKVFRTKQFLEEHTERRHPNYESEREYQEARENNIREKNLKEIIEKRMNSMKEHFENLMKKDENNDYNRLCQKIAFLEKKLLQQNSNRNINIYQNGFCKNCSQKLNSNNQNKKFQDNGQTSNKEIYNKKVDKMDNEEEKLQNNNNNIYIDKNNEVKKIDEKNKNLDYKEEKNIKITTNIDINSKIFNNKYQNKQNTSQNQNKPENRIENNYTLRQSDKDEFKPNDENENNIYVQPPYENQDDKHENKPYEKTDNKYNINHSKSSKEVQKENEKENQNGKMFDNTKTKTGNEEITKNSNVNPNQNDFNPYISENDKNKITESIKIDINPNINNNDLENDQNNLRNKNNIQEFPDNTESKKETKIIINTEDNSRIPNEDNEINNNKQNIHEEYKKFEQKVKGRDKELNENIVDEYEVIEIPNRYNVDKEKVNENINQYVEDKLKDKIENKYFDLENSKEFDEQKVEDFIRECKVEIDKNKEKKGKEIYKLLEIDTILNDFEEYMNEKNKNRKESKNDEIQKEQEKRIIKGSTNNIDAPKIPEKINVDESKNYYSNRASNINKTNSIKNINESSSKDNNDKINMIANSLNIIEDNMKKEEEPKKAIQQSIVTGYDLKNSVM